MIEAYGNLLSFYVTGLLALPAIVLGLLGRPIRRYGLIASVIGIVLLLARDPAQLAWLAGFVVVEFTLIVRWLSYRTTHQPPHQPPHPWAGRIAAVLATLPLVVVKAAGAFGWNEIGFLGISYLSFRVIQVVLEIGDGLITTMSLGELAYFVLFFPTVTSGPIDRSRRFDQDATRSWTRSEYLVLLVRGLWLIGLGVIYSFVLAHWFASHLSWAVGGRSWAYMYLYTGRLFFDFAGYSAMAVGLSQIFGIRTPMNFRLPFLAESITDFWRRWHITLSFWFRDYLYARMTFFLLQRKVFSNRMTAGRVAMVANMALMGLWHGFRVHYIVYGLYHGLLLVANDIYDRRTRTLAFRGRLWYRLVSIAVTCQLVILGFWIFSGQLIRV